MLARIALARLWQGEGDQLIAVRLLRKTEMPGRGDHDELLLKIRR